MKYPFVPVAAAATLIVALPVLDICDSSNEEVAVIEDVQDRKGPQMLGNLPTSFVPNLGQWKHQASYVSQIGPMTVFLEEDGWTFTLVDHGEIDGEGASGTGDEESESALGVAVRMTFEGADEPQLTSESRLPGVHHYFLGNDPDNWRSDVPLYSSVLYREVYSGLDVRAREHGGHFEYDLLVDPGADLDEAVIRVEGASGLQINHDGALVMETALGPVEMPVPTSWEEGPDGERSPIVCHYVLLGEDRFGFEAPGRDSDWALVVDPGLVWTMMLGHVTENAIDIAVDAQGSVTIAGGSWSPILPTTPGAYDTTFTGYATDAFVTRLSPDGSSLVYSTFLGGTDDDWNAFFGQYDRIDALALDGDGAAIVVGSTPCTDFPTTPGAYR